RQPEVPSRIPVGEPFVVETEQIQDRGVQVVNMHVSGIVRNKEPVMADLAFGVTVRVNWTSSPQIGGLLDSSWEASALAVAPPKGKWWGPWIALAGKPATEGESEYDRTRKELVLWVPFQVEGITARFLLMGLNAFDVPPPHGSGGSGNLYPAVRL